MRRACFSLTLMLFSLAFLTGLADGSHAQPPNHAFTTIQEAHGVEEARAAGDYGRSAQRIFAFLTRPLPRSEYLHFLGKIGLPLSKQEAQAFENLILDREHDLIHQTTLQTGHNLAAFGNDDGSSRLEIIFLNQDELDLYKKALEQKKKTGKPLATFFSPELEGRLCGYAVDRKAFLGGSHMEFSQFAKEKLWEKK